jgi:hypothetical protein
MSVQNNKGAGLGPRRLSRRLSVCEYISSAGCGDDEQSSIQFEPGESRFPHLSFSAVAPVEHGLTYRWAPRVLVA